MYGMMVAVVLIIFALAIAPVLTEVVADTMNESSGDTLGLDCDNDSINNFNKAACIATDLTPFYVVGFIILLAGAVITARFI